MCVCVRERERGREREERERVEREREEREWNGMYTYIKNQNTLEACTTLTDTELKLVSRSLFASSASFCAGNKK